MLSYPVLTGNTAVDEHIFTWLRKDAAARKLNHSETQQCFVTFARRMLQMAAARKSLGKTMAGAEFVQWLEAAAIEHSSRFLEKYHPVGTHTGSVFGSYDTVIVGKMTSKQDEIGSGYADEIMLSEEDGVLASAVCQLTASSRIIVLWHYFGGISVTEIADKIGISETKVRARITRAARELYMVLARNGYASSAPGREFRPHRATYITPSATPAMLA